MAKIRKRKIRWDPSSSEGVIGYRLYWSQDGTVDYDSESAELGKVTQIALPDDVPSFPLIEGEMDLGVTAVTQARNESDFVRVTAHFDFLVPEPPKNIKIED
jgi:hypothetical protein